MFTGPVFAETDPVLANTRPGRTPARLPAGVWKVAAFAQHGSLCAVGLLMWQCDINEDGSGRIAFDPVLEQVRMTTIEHLAGICFSDGLRRADPIRFGVAEAPGAILGAGDLTVG